MRRSSPHCLRRTVHRLGLVASLAALGAWGCARAGVDDSRTSVRLATGPDWLQQWPPHADPQVPVATLLRTALEEASFRVVDAASEGALPEVGVVAIVPGPAADTQERWVLTLGLTGTGEAGLGPTLVVDAPMLPGSEEALAERWGRTFALAAEGLSLRHRLRGASDAALVAALSDPSPSLAAAAADRLVERRNPAVLPYLFTELRKAPDDAALRALGGLVALRERSAVRSIVEEADRRSLTFRIQAFHALGALGGDEAEAYLFAADAGDPDARVRTAARESLEFARRVRDEPASPFPEARW